MVKNIKIKSSKLSLRSATDLPAHSTGEQTQATTAIASATMYPKNLLLDAMIARGAEGKALNEMLDPNQLTSEPLSKVSGISQLPSESPYRRNVNDSSRAESTHAEAIDEQRLKTAAAYTKPFCDFLINNPTIWHVVAHYEKRLQDAGFKHLSPRTSWGKDLSKGGKFYTTRNGNALIAFTIGDKYESGNGVAMIAGHIDALTARLKPISKKHSVLGYSQLGVAPYAGAMSSTWWDRDLSIGGRVLVQDPESKIVTTKLVKLDWPIAKISTLAPHFGVPMTGQGNTETEMTPIIGLDSKDVPLVGEEGSFTASQPPRLVQVIAKELSLDQPENIVGWELELYNYEPARTIGLDHELISAGRIDDKLCSWSAMEALIASSTENASSGVIKLVALFDNEEIGSQTRQGAKGTFLPSTIARVVETFAKGDSCNALAATQANSFLLSADVVHAGHPNFVHVYEAAHTPRLNVGLGIHWNGQGHMATDGVSAAFMEQIAHRVGQKMQYFVVPNDRRSGGTIGPMLSTQMGCRAVDVGAPMLGMHSVRSTTGALDPGLGVQIYKGFFDEYEDVDRLFAQ